MSYLASQQASNLPLCKAIFSAGMSAEKPANEALCGMSATAEVLVLKNEKIINRAIDQSNLYSVICRAVPNTGLELFGRIRIVTPTIRPNTNANTNSSTPKQFKKFHHATCA